MALVSPRATALSHPVVPIEWEGEEREHRRKIALALNGVLRGQLNNLGSVTLTASSTTSAVRNPNVSAGSKIFLFPTTANAATALATTYKSAAEEGLITLTHASNAQTDRTFDYAVFC